MTTNEHASAGTEAGKPNYRVINIGRKFDPRNEFKRALIESIASDVTDESVVMPVDTAANDSMEGDHPEALRNPLGPTVAP